MIRKSVREVHRPRLKAVAEPNRGMSKTFWKFVSPCFCAGQIAVIIWIEAHFVPGRDKNWRLAYGKFAENHGILGNDVCRKLFAPGYSRLAGIALSPGQHVGFGQPQGPQATIGRYC